MTQNIFSMLRWFKNPSKLFLFCYRKILILIFRSKIYSNKYIIIIHVNGHTRFPEKVVIYPIICWYLYIYCMTILCKLLSAVFNKCRDWFLYTFVFIFAAYQMHIFSVSIKVTLTLLFQISALLYDPSDSWHYFIIVICPLQKKLG